MFHFKILANISATYTSIRDARWFYFCVRFLTYLKETNKHWCSFVYCRQDPYTVHLSKVLYFEVWFSLFYSFEVGKLIMIGSLSCEPCFFFFLTSFLVLFWNVWNRNMNVTWVKSTVATRFPSLVACFVDTGCVCRSNMISEIKKWKNNKK